MDSTERKNARGNWITFLIRDIRDIRVIRGRRPRVFLHLLSQPVRMGSE